VLHVVGVWFDDLTYIYKYFSENSKC
jgi:hypothetical protein